MIKKLKPHNTYDGFTYPSPKETMNKINEIIDYLNVMEESRMIAGTGGSDVSYSKCSQEYHKQGQGGDGGGDGGIFQIRKSDGSIFFIKGGGAR